MSVERREVDWKRYCSGCVEGRVDVRLGDIFNIEGEQVWGEMVISADSVVTMRCPLWGTDRCEDFIKYREKRRVVGERMVVEELMKAGFGMRYLMGVEDVYSEEVRGFINRYVSENDMGSIYVWGDVDAGKSCLLGLLARRLWVERYSLGELLRVKYLNYAEIPKVDDVDELIDVDVLIVDDVGAVNIGGYVSVFYSVVEKRYADGKRIWVASNLSIEGLSKEVSGRIASRLSEGYIIPLPKLGLRVSKEVGKAERRKR